MFSIVSFEDHRRSQLANDKLPSMFTIVSFEDHHRSQLANDKLPSGQRHGSNLGELQLIFLTYSWSRKAGEGLLRPMREAWVLRNV